MFAGVLFCFRQSILVALCAICVCLVVCVHRAVCAGYKPLPLNPPVGVELPPVKSGCMQTVYLTTKGERYGMECDIRQGWMTSSYGNADSLLTIERVYSEFFQDIVTKGWILKPGCQHPTAEDWMQVQTPWAFKDRYES